MARDGEFEPDRHRYVLSARDFLSAQYVECIREFFGKFYAGEQTHQREEKEKQ
jgi:hypothetical protein